MERIENESVSPFRVYVCVICGFVYDEAAGCPEEGIAPGTRWAEIPPTWRCPDCGIGKADFELLQL